MVRAVPEGQATTDRDTDEPDTTSHEEDASLIH
jgi:hypothetical protein